MGHQVYLFRKEVKEQHTERTQQIKSSELNNILRLPIVGVAK